jgi:hypothetical protein
LEDDAILTDDFIRRVVLTILDLVHVFIGIKVAV